MNQEDYHFMKEKHLKELKLLIISLIVFFLAIANAEEFPAGPNDIRAGLDDFLREGLMKVELYEHDKVEAGTQNIVTRKQLEEGEIAVLKYGNKRPSAGRYPHTVWARHLIQKKIDEELENEGLDPKLPEEALTPKQRETRQRVIRNMRKETGFTFGERHSAIEQKEKELERKLTDQELTDMTSQYPIKEDIQADELEAIAILPKTTIYKVHEIFIDQNRYEKIFPAYFHKSHVLTEDDLKKREIVLKPGENLFYAHLKLDDTVIKYTVRNQWRRETRRVKLNDQWVDIPLIITAWTIDKRFFSPLDAENRDPFSHEGAFVTDGYLELEPYIEKDSNGVEKISDSRVLAVYHIYTRMDELYKDLSSIEELFRESVGRVFCQTILRKFKEILG